MALGCYVWQEPMCTTRTSSRWRADSRTFHSPLTLTIKGFSSSSGGFAAEVGGQVDRAVHAFEGFVNGVKIGDISVNFLAVQVPVNVPGLRVEFKGADLVLAGEIFEHGPSQPAGGAKYGNFHNNPSEVDLQLKDSQEIYKVLSVARSNI